MAKQKNAFPEHVQQAEQEPSGVTDNRQRQEPVASNARPLAPVNTPAMPLAPIDGGVERPMRVNSSLSPLDPKEKRLAFRSMQSQDIAGADVIGQPIEVVHWLTHDITLEDPVDGECRDCVRTVLIASDGKRIGFVSDGIVKALRAFITWFGPAPWNPPAKIIVTAEKAKIGKWYSIDPVE